MVIAEVDEDQIVTYGDSHIHVSQLTYLVEKPAATSLGDVTTTMGFASTAKAGTISRIVPQHPEGAIVSVPRTYVHYVVTEYGVVDLLGKSQRERAERLISIAHPDFRDALKAAAKTFFWP